MVNVYAILDADGRCINRVLWDGKSPWQPPKDCTAVEDPENLYPLITPFLETEVIDDSTEENTATDLTVTSDTTDSTVTPDAKVDLKQSDTL